MDQQDAPADDPRMRGLDPAATAAVPGDVQADLAATAALPVAAPLRAATFPYQPGDLIIPGYRLTKRLGSGGFGEVWRAEASGGMGVAIKILANLGRREGGREFRALQTIKNIRHAHIVPMFGVWLKSNDGHVLDEAELRAAEKRILATGPAAGDGDGDAAATTLESLELIVAMGLGDQTLFDRLRDVKRAGARALPPEELLPWMQQAALALDHFNTKSRRSAENVTAIQHCDIKPQNMLLVGDVVQVCDFGLARAQGEVRATSNTMASLAYAAPEMVSPPYDPSPATDQYSLAISYIELRTGRLPYAETSPMTIIRAKLDGRLDLAGLEPAECRVLEKALEVDPARRWSTCTDFIRALRGATRQAGLSSGSLSAELAPHDAVPAAWAETLPAGRGPSGTTVDAPADAPPPGSRVGLRRAAVAGAVAVAIAVAGGYAVMSARRTAVGSSAPSSSIPPAAAGSRERAAFLEEQGDFAAAAAEHAAIHVAEPDALAAILWDLQTKAADAGRSAECIPLLDRLERLYSASPAPQVKGIARWDVVNSLAWYLATQPGADAAAGRRSRRLADEAIVLAGTDAVMRSQSLDTLAAAAAREGDWDEAVRRIDQAIGLVQDSAQRSDFEKRRARYAAKKPWDER